MATNIEIHEFAVRWLEKYRSPHITEYEVTEGFADACVALGFGTNGAEAFEEAYPNTNAFNDSTALYAIKNQIHDVQLLGSAIFSRWIQVTQNTQTSLLSPPYKNWFITALSRLRVLSIENCIGSFAANGHREPDCIERFIVDYHRVTNVKLPLSEPNDTAIWNYTEQLTLDRATETLEHIQNVGSGCVISRKYYIVDGVSSLLNHFDAQNPFGEIQGNPPDAIDDPNETKDYTITIYFQRRLPIVLKGSYDKNDLPENWSELMSSIRSFMRYYDIGEILDSYVYTKVKRRINDYIFCSVEFEDCGKSYYYLTNDDTLIVGDLVVVPVGNKERTSIVEIVDIEYFSENNVPFPLDEVKHILRKCTSDDFEQSVPKPNDKDTDI
ncbi:MAG: hypothetical protein RR954_05615 [Christensenellaceae bacterium]